MRRFAEAAARERDDVKPVGERRREVVVRVRGVAEPGQEDERLTRSAEVEIVQSHVRARP